MNELERAAQDLVDHPVADPTPVDELARRASAAAGRTRMVQIVLAVAALGFLGAGVFPLGRASELHISLIAIAFVAVVVAMYLVPSEAAAQFGGRVRYVSWGLAGATALSVFLGHSILPIGVGQRLAAGCVVIWLCFAGARLRGW